jgi:hypothetical protein
VEVSVCRSPSRSAPRKSLNHLSGEASRRRPRETLWKTVYRPLPREAPTDSPAQRHNIPSNQPRVKPAESTDCRCQSTFPERREQIPKTLPLDLRRTLFHFLRMSLLLATIGGTV